MRVLTLVAVSALLISEYAEADPAQIQSAPAATVSQPAAPPAPQMAQTPAPAPQSDPDQIVCKPMPAQTGSRIGGGRECRTQREWDQRMKESQSILNGSQLRGLEGSAGTGN